MKEKVEEFTNLAQYEVDILGNTMHNDDQPMIQVTNRVPVVKCCVDSQQQERHSHVREVLHFHKPGEPVICFLALQWIYMLPLRPLFLELVVNIYSCYKETAYYSIKLLHIQFTPHSLLPGSLILQVTNGGFPRDISLFFG